MSREFGPASENPHRVDAAERTETSDDAERDLEEANQLLAVGAEELDHNRVIIARRPRRGYGLRLTPSRRESDARLLAEGVVVADQPIQQCPLEGQ